MCRQLLINAVEALQIVARAASEDLIARSASRPSRPRSAMSLSARVFAEAVTQATSLGDHMQDELRGLDDDDRSDADALLARLELDRGFPREASEAS